MALAYASPAMRQSKNEKRGNEGMKKNHRLITSVLALMMLFSLTSCSDPGNKPTGTGSSTQPSTASVELRIASGQTSGTGYQWGVAAADIITKALGETGIISTPIVTTGGSDSVSLLGVNEAEFAIATPTITYCADQGVFDFEGRQIDNLCVIMSQFPEYFQICVPADSPCNSLADLEGKRVAVGNKGGTFTSIGARLEALGIDCDTYFDAFYLTTSEAVTALQDRDIDAFFYVTGIGGSALQVAESSIGLKLISLSEEEVATICEKIPLMHEATIPAGSYKGIDHDVLTVGGGVALISRLDVSEDVVYEVTKTLVENQETIWAVNKSFSYTGAENTVTDYYGYFPIHPGAEKYYKEIGLIQ